MPMLCSLRSRKQQTKAAHFGHTIPKVGVLLAIESATPAENVAIMRSIVEILKRVSPMGEVEHIEKETGSKGVKTPGPLKPLAK
ncbi:unnamed protein product [Pocillopora meandrina]|uniref:Uncharacterized protein n=1 Tax=Pocillopora meandrina TaxID=46732 RepID=A0AAU9WEY4_9CNID|nr:unnamed protein product [Pocillopora meandrina]